MKSFKQYLEESLNTMSIYDTLEDDTEDIPENEILYNYVDEDDIHKELPIKPISNPKKLLTHNGDITVFDSRKFATDESKEIIDYYKRKPINDVIVVKGNTVLDGNHRVIGSILGKWNLRAIDINDLPTEFE